MPLKPHPNDPDKMVYVSRQYDIPQPQGIPQLQGVTTAQPEQEPWPEEPFGHMAGGVQPPQPEQEPAQEPWRESASDYERGFIDGRQKQAQSSVDKAVNRMAQRTWVGLTNDDWNSTPYDTEFRAGAEWAEAKLMKKNT